MVEEEEVDILVRIRSIQGSGKRQLLCRNLACTATKSGIYFLVFNKSIPFLIGSTVALGDASLPKF